MLDLPVPKTKVPEAAHQYALGIGAFHDDNGNAAVEHFERAVKLDPTMAAGHLRVAMAHFQTTASPERVQAAFARAAELRADLDERDAALMSALEPTLARARPDPLEAARRIDALVEKRPLDVELYDWLGWLRGMTPMTLPHSARALALDPTDANALQIRGIALAMAGRIDEARASFESCTALSPTVSDCLASQAWTDMLAGRCADFESDARRLVDRSKIYGHAILTSALVANGKPDAAVREECDLLLGEWPAEDRKVTSLALDTQLALVAGDFARARTLATREADAIRDDATSRSDYLKHYRLTMQSLTAALESGDAEGAHRVAADFAARSGSWQEFVLFNGGMNLAAYALRLAPGDFEPRRRERIDRWLANGGYRGMVWPYAFAAPASTPDEARAALDVMPDHAPISSFVNSMWIYLGDVGLPDAAVGHVYLLAGKPIDALPYLRRAAAACADFDAILMHTRAALDLGVALEATGDDRGACEAYGKVLARWGRAKPRSVTADEARARGAKLGCRWRAP